MPRAAAIPGQFGYVGLIKPYKGVERLVDAFAEASAIDPTLTLRISGKPANEAIERRLRTATERLSGLDTTLRYVSEQAFVDVVTSSELVVLPYRFMHNSGTALAALSLGRPILVPDNDLNRALSSEVGPGWVHLFDGELTAGTLLDAIRAVRAEPPAAAPDLSAREWHDVGARHARAYELAIGRRERPHRPIASATTPNGGRRRRARRRDPDVPAAGSARERAHRGTGAGRRRERPARGPDALLDPRDRQRSARSGERVAAEHGVTYVVEPRPGIAAVRNRALAECESAAAGVLLFIDDDETPEPGWLRAMIEMYTTTRPTAVAGRVVTRLPDAVEPWVSRAARSNARRVPTAS